MAKFVPWEKRQYIMNKMTQYEMEITGNVPREVKDRVRTNLCGHEIDFSDILEITEWSESLVSIFKSIGR
jgi:hypothetical protein